MTIKENSDEARALEDLIDRHTLADVLQALADIARGKAEHLCTNWQDQSAGMVWRKAGTRISLVADGVTV